MSRASGILPNRRSRTEGLNAQRSKSKKDEKDTSKESVKKISLIRDQEAQAKSLIEILKRSVVAFDMSMMGAGKTYVSSEVATRFGFKNVVVVCPASVSGKWEEMKRFKAIKSTNFIVLSYEALRSTTPRGLDLGGPRLLSHGLLYRKDPNVLGSILKKEKSIGLGLGRTASGPEALGDKLPSIPKTFGPGQSPKASGQGSSPKKEMEDEKEQSSKASGQDESPKTEFFPSEELINIIKEGCLFIFDEAQKIRNKTAQWLATRCIADTLLKYGGKSRFLLLSGTPIDKEEHTINLMQMMGFIKSVKLYDSVDSLTGKNAERSIKLIGAQELINFCMRISENARKTTEKIVRVLNVSNNFGLGNKATVREGVIHLCYRLFQEVIKKEITSSMAPPDLSDRGVVLDIKNGYYKFESFSVKALTGGPKTSNSYVITEAEVETRKRELMKSLDLLNRMMKVGRIGGAITKAAGTEDYINKFGLTKPLKMIETAKVPLFIRKAYETLTKIPNSKVCIFVNYLDNLAEIANALSEFDPIIMNGSVDKKKRQELIELFQKPDLEYRVYISILSVSSTGIDLDDQSPKGLYPRYAFASPGFKIDELHQLTRRFYRANTQSSTVFRFVYAKGFEEVGLLNNLAKKTNVMKETLEKQVAGGVKFPGEYENDVEDLRTELMNKVKKFFNFK
jgi:hypothetical protein